MKRLYIAIAVLACATVAQETGETQELTPRIALGVVTQAAKSFRGTWDEHALIHASLRQLEAAVQAYEAQHKEEHDGKQEQNQ